MSPTLLRPGVVVTTQQAPNPRGTGVNTGTWFVVGAAEKGSTTNAQLIRNMNDFALYYGARKSYSILYDTLDTFFREGGSQAVVARVDGASGATAGVTLNDSAPAASIKVSAKNNGIWGNSLLAAVVSATGGYQIVVTHTTLGTVETSPILTSQADAVTWSRNAIWVNVTIPGGAGVLNPAVVSATAMTGGVDGYSGINDTIRQAALALFTPEMGPGQVSIPGTVSSGNRTALITHAAANNRQAYLDCTDPGGSGVTTSTLQTEAVGLQGNEYGALFGPWLIVPGLAATPTNPRTVPPCALAAALVARGDAADGQNIAAAGVKRGVATYVLGVTGSPFNAVDSDLLNTAGLNLFKQINGRTILFSNRTLASANSVWTWLANQRFRLLLQKEFTDALLDYLDEQIDGQGITLAAANGALSGICNRHYNEGALYGATAREAYTVDTGPSQNTPDSIANRELHAAVAVRVSPGVELAVISVTAVSVSQNL